MTEVERRNNKTFNNIINQLDQQTPIDQSKQQQNALSSSQD